MDDKIKQWITRITVDLDTRNINNLIKCLKTLKKYHFNKDLEIRTSPSKKGYHVISWSEKGVTLEKLLKIRLRAGDDKIRCMLDNKSHRQIQVLFTDKKKQKTNLVLDNILMEYETEGYEINEKISIGEI